MGLFCQFLTSGLGGKGLSNGQRLLESDETKVEGRAEKGFVCVDESALIASWDASTEDSQNGAMLLENATTTLSF